MALRLITESWRVYSLWSQLFLKPSQLCGYLLDRNAYIMTATGEAKFLDHGQIGSNPVVPAKPGQEHQCRKVGLSSTIHLYGKVTWQIFRHRSIFHWRKLTLTIENSKMRAAHANIRNGNSSVRCPEDIRDPRPGSIHWSFSFTPLMICASCLNEARPRSFAS